MINKKEDVIKELTEELSKIYANIAYLEIKAEEKTRELKFIRKNGLLPLTVDNVLKKQ